MDTKFLYPILSKFYDLIDVIYFRRDEYSPRKVVCEAIEDQDSVLDLCTGTATNAAHIAAEKPGTKVVGIDRSRDMLRVGERKIRKKQIPNIRLFCMDATRLQFKDQCFDKVLLSLVLHETEEDLAGEILTEIRRVMKADGELLVTEWELSDSLFRKIVFFPVRMLEPKPFRAFIKKDLNQYFGELGFEVVEEYHCDYSHVMKLKKADSIR